MGLKLMTPLQSLYHKGYMVNKAFACFPPLWLDNLITPPVVIPDSKTVQHYIDYDRNILFLI